jgi:hypothetical protein
MEPLGAGEWDQFYWLLHRAINADGQTDQECLMALRGNAEGNEDRLKDLERLFDWLTR